MIIAIVLTVMLPGTGFTNIVCSGTVVGPASKPLAYEPINFYSGIILGAYTNAGSLTPDRYGRFHAIFRKEYTITKLESLLKLSKIASPPFFFGFKLPRYYDGDNGKSNGHYYIVEVGKKGTSVSAIRDFDHYLDKKANSNRLHVSAKLSRVAENWHI